MFLHILNPERRTADAAQASSKPLRALRPLHPARGAFSAVDHAKSAICRQVGTDDGKCNACINGDEWAETYFPPFLPLFMFLVQSSSRSYLGIVIQEVGACFADTKL